MASLPPSPPFDQRYFRPMDRPCFELIDVLKGWVTISSFWNVVNKNAAAKIAGSLMVMENS
jgi:hypothetical protein